MWKNPDIILDIDSPRLVSFLLENDFRSKSFPPGNLDYLQEAYDLSRDLYDQLRSQGTKQDIEATFRTEVQRIAGDVEQKKKWHLVANVARVSQFLSAYAQRTGESTKTQQVFQVYVRDLVHFLVGNETKILIGTRGNQPTWVKWRHLHDIEGTLATNLDFSVEYIGREESDLFDGAGMWPFQKDLSSLPDVENCWYKAADLLESAYYNQQYAPHSEGSFVKLQGVHSLDNVIIKVKRGLRDRNFIDILALFTFTDGCKYLQVLDGRVTTRELEEDFRRRVSDLREAPRSDTFLIWLTALIYHDLVTAKKDIRAPRSVSEAVAAAKLEKPEHVPEVRWTYIPRIVRKRPPLDVRLPAMNPRSMSPHRVSGHKRKGNMSDQQRDLIQDFEQETGLEVLKWVPEGYTFVRPYVVPAGESAECIQHLPRFIRTRIQSELRQLLSREESGGDSEQ